jgi:branched-chain amino acid transport system permease protein
MVALALVFNRVVLLRRLVGQPLIAVIMVTLGLGALMRGAAPFLFAGVPGRLPLPIPEEPLVVLDIAVPITRLVALGVAIVAIVAVAAFFRWTRTGVALRALADDQEVALSVGIDVNRHLAITWGLVGLLSVLAGTLWALIAGWDSAWRCSGSRCFPSW